MHSRVFTERWNETFHEMVMGPADKPGIVLFRGGKGFYQLRQPGNELPVFIPYLADTEEELFVFHERPEIH